MNLKNSTSLSPTSHCVLLLRQMAVDYCFKKEQHTKKTYTVSKNRINVGTKKKRGNYFASNNKLDIESDNLAPTRKHRTNLSQSRGKWKIVQTQLIKLRNAHGRIKKMVVFIGRSAISFCATNSELVANLNYALCCVGVPFLRCNYQLV